eukprot:38091-Pleurochrysis_carterae.AAC.2
MTPQSLGYISVWDVVRMRYYIRWFGVGVTKGTGFATPCKLKNQGESGCCMHAARIEELMVT